MLSCDEALELISARLDGPLSEEETARLEKHLSACQACRTLAADLKLLHQELPDLAVQPPVGLKERVMDRIHDSKELPFSNKKRRWRWRSLASLAAVAALVLVGAGVKEQWRANGMLGSEAVHAGVSAAVETVIPASGDKGRSVTREVVPQPTQIPAEKDGQENETTGDSSSQSAGGGQDSRSSGGSSQAGTPKTVMASPAPAGNGVEPYRVTPDAPSVNPSVTSAGLTEEEALYKLAAWLGWSTDGLTVDKDGAITGPTAADGTTTRLICAGLNQEGTGWVCQLEQITPGPDGIASCTAYTVPLDGNDITQP